MSKSILIIQFRENKDVLLSERQSFLRCFNKYGIKLSFINMIDSNMQWDNSELIINGHRGVILGGSGDFDFDGNRSKNDPRRKKSYEILNTLKHFLQYLFDNNIPVFGICYGHQILAAFRGIEIVSDKNQSKVGSYRVSIDKKHISDPLFKNLPVNFIVQYGHKDSLKDLPLDAELIAYGLNCKYSAIKYSPFIYSVQFHPEINYEDMLNRLKNSHGYLPGDINLKALIKKSTKSEIILKNFTDIAFEN